MLLSSDLRWAGVRLLSSQNTHLLIKHNPCRHRILCSTSGSLFFWMCSPVSRNLVLVIWSRFRTQFLLVCLTLLAPSFNLSAEAKKTGCVKSLCSQNCAFYGQMLVDKTWSFKRFNFLSMMRHIVCNINYRIFTKIPPLILRIDRYKSSLCLCRGIVCQLFAVPA